MAGDRLATEGHRVASRDLQKVYPTDAHSLVAIAGAAGPGHRDGAHAPHRARALREDRGRGARARGQGQQALADGAREPAGRDAGPRRRADLRGLRPAPAASAGSGSTTSPAVATRRPSSSRRAAAASTPASRSRRPGAAISAATTRCASRCRRSPTRPTRIARTGGVDLARGIFPIVCFCTASGVEEVAREEIERTYREHVAIARQRVGAGT